MRTIKTKIRTKSGNLREKLVVISEEDYDKLAKEMDKDEDEDSNEEEANIRSEKIKAKIFAKYLGKEAAARIEKVNLKEQKAIKVQVKTADGKITEKIVHVSKDEYEKAQKGGEAAISKLLAKDKGMKKLMKHGGEIATASEAKMTTIKTVVRTKSGKLKKQVVTISEEDKQKIESGDADAKEILKKYVPLEKGQKLEAIIPPTEESKPFKVLSTTIRKKDGTVEERQVLLSEEQFKEYQEALDKPSADIDQWLKEHVRLKSNETLEKVEKVPTEVFEGVPRIPSFGRCCVNNFIHHIFIHPPSVHHILIALAKLRNLYSRNGNFQNLFSTVIFIKIHLCNDYFTVYFK